MPEIHAKLADGTILSFPDGTKDDVIDRTVKEHLASIPKPGIPLSNLRSSVKELPNDISTGLNAGFSGGELPPTADESKAKLLSAARFGVDAAGGAAGSYLGYPNAGISVADYLFKKASGEPENVLGNKVDTGSKILDAGIDIAGNSLLNKGMGAAFNLPFKGASALINAAKETESGVKAFSVPVPFRKTTDQGNILTSIRDKFIQATGIIQNKGSVVGDIANLDPTVSQYNNGTFSKWIEDTFAPTAKAEAVANSAVLAKKEALSVANENIGQPPIPYKYQDRNLNFSDLEKLPAQNQKDVIQSFKNSVKASTAEGENVGNIASQNVLKFQREVSPATQVPSGVLDANGNPILTTVPAKLEDVSIEGAIPTDRHIARLLALKNEIASPAAAPDPNNPLLKDINEFLDRANAKFDDKGNLVSSEPLDFKTMWETKKLYGQKGFGDPLQNVDPVDSRYKGIYHGLDEDIQNGIADWKVNGDFAMQSYANAKAISNQRHELFQANGSGIKNILNTAMDVSPNIDAALNDYKEIQRLKLIGNLKVDGMPKAITSDGSLQDYRQYKFMSFIKNAIKSTDAADLAQGKLNTGSLVNEFNSYADSQAGRELYTSNQRADIGQFFSNMQHVDTASNPRGVSHYIMMRVGSQTFGLGAALSSAVLGLGGYVSPMHAVEVGALGGAVLSLQQTAKLLTNPTTARLLISMGKGGPLSMSQQMAGRLIAQVLRNETINVDTKDGNQKSGTFDKDGKFKLN